MVKRSRAYYSLQLARHEFLLMDSKISKAVTALVDLR
jgi:hypothetical protein